MIFNELRLQHFKKFEDLSIRFTEGINVVKGSNEQGKSTILDAIRHVLFTSPATKSQKITSIIQRWQSNQKPSLSLTYAIDGSVFTIKKDFVTEESSLSKGKKVISEDISDIDEQVQNALGIRSEGVFESTAYVQQYEVSKIVSEKELMESVRRVLITGKNDQVSVRELINKLEQKIKTYTLGIERETKNPGIIRGLTDDIQEKQQALSDIQEEYAEVLDAGKTRKEVEKRLHDTDKKILLLGKQLENFTILKESEENLERIEKEIVQIEKRLHEINRIESEIAAADEKLSAYKNTDVDTLHAQYEQIVQNNTETKVIQKDIDYLTRHIKALHPEKKDQFFILGVVSTIFDGSFPKIMLALSLTAFFAAVVVSFFNVYLGIILGLITIILLSTGYRKTLGVIDQGLDGYRENLRSKQKRFQKLVHENKKLLAVNGCDNLKDFNEQRKIITRNVRDRDNLDSRLTGLLREDSLKGLQDQQFTLMARKKELLSTFLTDEVKAAAMKPGEYYKKKNELESLQKQREKLFEQLSLTQATITQSKVDREKVVLLEERIQQLQDQLSREKNQLAMYEQTRLGIMEALQRLSGQIGERIEKEIERYLPQLTGGRYKKIKITNDFDVEIYSQEKSDWVNPVGVLSTGTVEQIYLLLRIVFLEIITQNSGSPLFLDDTFVSFDNERREQALGILQDISQRRQIVLLTCHNDYDGWGNLIEI